MTGIERLRDWSGTMRLVGLAWAEDMADALESIADQIEREMAPKTDTSPATDTQNPSWHDPADAESVSSDAAKVTRGPSADVPISAYDLLPADEREAIAWVRENGGLGAMQARVDTLQDTLDWLRERAGVGNDELVDYDELLEALNRRLMPEGMEWLVEAWPRFEDDAPVRFGDMALIDGDADMVEAVQLWIHGKPVIYGDGGSQQLEKGERIKRPAPKVLDADGAEIELGDDLYSVEGSLKFHVSHVDRTNGKIATDAMFALDKWADPTMYTHRAPVIAADGKPLREGEMVWDKDTGDRFEVDGFSDDGFAVCWDVDKCEADIEIKPSQLTHERPVVDTWERLEEDAGKDPCDYFGFDGDETCGKCPASGKNCEQTMARDLVRRARALAGDA